MADRVPPCIGEDVLRLPIEPSLGTACLTPVTYLWDWVDSDGEVRTTIFLCVEHCALLREEHKRRPGRLPYRIRTYA